jgi:hypothetical protein
MNTTEALKAFKAFIDDRVDARLKEFAKTAKTRPGAVAAPAAAKAKAKAAVNAKTGAKSGAKRGPGRPTNAELAEPAPIATLATTVSKTRRTKVKAPAAKPPTAGERAAAKLRNGINGHAASA